MIGTILSVLLDRIVLIPLIASTLMCLASSLVGVLVVLRKRSLLGEALSHAAYPGIGLAVLIQAALFADYPALFPIVVMCGAAVSSFLGLRGVSFLENSLGVSSDASLCFILSTFLGFGVLIASYLQCSSPMLFQKVNMYLYGQVATLRISHITLYAILTCIVVAALIILYHPIQVVIFDKTFAKMVSIRVAVVDGLIVTLLLLAILIGMRTVGVILMAGMLIAPAAAARQYVSSLSGMLIVAGILGIVSALLGTALSIAIPLVMKQIYPDVKFILSSGPMILLVAATLCFCSLLFSPRSGWILRAVRRSRFQSTCLQENLLKDLYKGKKNGSRRIIRSLKAKELIERSGHDWILTAKGEEKAKRIIRLHRLWEAYLFSELGYQADRVHKNAEEMEHILTPEMEEELSKLLKDPKYDPHQQVIPTGGGV